MKRLAFINSSHHKETRSSEFLINLLSPFFDIDIYWDESNMGGSKADVTAIEKENYDIVLIFQTGTYLNHYFQIDCQAIICVPNVILNHNSVIKYFPKKIKYLSFSKAQNDILSTSGLNSVYFQYYPNPYRFVKNKDYNNLKGFHWCRSPEVSPNTIRQLISGTEFAKFHVHDAAMPGICSPVNEKKQYTGHNESCSKWFKERNEYFKILKGYNVFFTPRLYEVVPNAILDAMSQGMCVVAPDLPSANEYIKDGENGILYDPWNLGSLEFRNAEALGRNARKSVEKGYDRWLNQRQEIFKFITGIPQENWDWTEVLEPKSKTKVNLNENLSLIGDHQRNRKMKFEGGKKLFRKQTKAPLLTVVTVVRNSEITIEKTIKSVLSQTFEDFEYIIIDGMSSDGTIDIVQKYENFLDYWCSELDEGPYHAMNKAINIAKGQYIVFMNAGDWFATPYVLEKVFQNTSEESEIIYGDHIWLNDGTPNFHKSLQFSAIQGILDTGTNQVAHWYQGLPNHQSTFIKTKLLRQNPFNTNYKIAADYDFLFKMALNGVTFLQLDLLISVYPSGGFSGQNEELCHEEWRKVFSQYRKFRLDNKTNSGVSSQKRVKCIRSPAITSSEYFSGKNNTNRTTKFTERLKALAAVNECARVYLTTPCLNAIDTIDQTIFSAISQVGSNYVLRYHIQDGGSTDGTIDRLNEWKRMLENSSTGNLSERWKNIIFSFKSEPDSGMYEAITRGFDFMEVPPAAILSWINADDILFQGAIATMVKIFREFPNVNWASGHNCLLNYAGELIGYNNEAKPSEYIRAGICEGKNWRFVQQEGTFFRKWLWDITGGFDKNLKYSADWDLWRRFAKKTELVHFPGPIAAFRLRPGQISVTEINKYMDEVDFVVPAENRSEAAKRISAEKGKKLKITSIRFTNRRFSIEKKPLESFRIPHEGRKLFSVESKQNQNETKKSLSKMSVSATTGLKNHKGDNKVDSRTNKLLSQSFDDKIFTLQGFSDSKNVIFSDGWYQLKNDASHLGYWTDGNGVIQLKSDHDGNAKISFRIGTASQKNSIHLAVNGQSLENFEIEQNFEIVKNMKIRLNAGINIFEISSRGELSTSSKDFRQVCFRVGDLNFSPPRFGFRSRMWIKAIKLKRSLFYEQYYLDQLSDKERSNSAPVMHYLMFGAWEARDPNPMFSSIFYLNNYRDVYLSGINPLLHYIQHGWREGRDPHPDFSTERYLSEHNDVKESGLNPLSHYLLHGILEDRKIFPSKHSN